MYVKCEKIAAMYRGSNLKLIFSPKHSTTMPNNYFIGSYYAREYNRYFAENTGNRGALRNVTHANVLYKRLHFVK